MTPDQEPTATVATDGWPLFQLGDWRVRPSTVLRKRRKDTARVFFLLPPANFTGSARLGVIDGSSREEFFHSWPGDRSRPAPDAAPEPMLFTARLTPPAGLIQADLLLEVSGQPRVTGALALPPLRFDAGTLHLLPIAPAPTGIPATGAPGALIDALLRLARRDPSLRLAVPGEWAELLGAPPRAERARKLAGQGRLDVLITPGTDPEALRALALPFPPRVAMRIGEADPARLRPDLRALLLVPRAEPASCAPGVGSSVGGTFVAVDGAGPYVLRACGQWIRGRTFGRGNEVSACAACDHALRGGMPLAPVAPRTPLELLRDLPPDSQSPLAVPEQPGRQRVLACQPLCLDHPDAWKHLAGDVRRWNRAHISPQLQILTPADHFAQIEQLHEEGSIRLAGLGAAP